ncbi:MAG: methionine--tRNA ligase [bacterium]
MEKNFYITTPIYYPSEKFHIGHCYTTIIADAISRYKRLDGYDVFFQTGTDEHGQKIANKAEANEVTPKEYVDKIIADAKDLWSELGITYDYFIRTTDEDHKEKVGKIFTKLYEQGDIYKGSYEGLYCVPCESFWTESQLVDGKCPDCGREVKLVEEESYFFKLSKYQDKLLELYEKNPNFILPISRKNELVNNFIKPGLEDLCVTRTSVEWGIKVPFDTDHTIYVWIDALSNYITSLGYPDVDSEKFKKFWPANLHLVGKEITRFHAIIWPALLMALDVELPEKVFGHGWLIINGGKISKSLGNYEDPREYVKKFGVDAVRYYALKEVPVGSDGSFSIDSLISRANSDLANTLGNLVTRTVSMSHKYFDGYVNNLNVIEDCDKELIDSANNLKTLVDEKIEALKINEAIEIIMEHLRLTNKYIDLTTPWVLAKEESSKDRLQTVLYNLIESIRISSILLEAFIPETSNKILEVINTKKTTFEFLNFGELEENLLLNEPVIIYSRIEGIDE